MTDVAVNAGVLATLVITKFTSCQRADPTFALLISGYMLWNPHRIPKMGRTGGDRQISCRKA
jgi:divalent metal cation (Fe/Co/Zn/Cd) transporter